MRNDKELSKMVDALTLRYAVQPPSDVTTGRPAFRQHEMGQASGPELGRRFAHVLGSIGDAAAWASQSLVEAVGFALASGHITREQLDEIRSRHGLEEWR
jgi:hypothetical protein